MPEAELAVLFHRLYIKDGWSRCDITLCLLKSCCLYFRAYSVFGVQVCSTVNEVLGTIAVSCPHSHVQRSAVQLRERRRRRRRGVYVHARRNSENQMSTKVEYLMKVSGRVLLTPLDGAKVIFKIKNRLQLLWPRVTLPHKSSTNLVSGGELGSSIQEELQGRQAASPAGPVDRCGLQLKTHTCVRIILCVCGGNITNKGGKREGVTYLKCSPCLFSP